jgi:hypothetical protein
MIITDWHSLFPNASPIMAGGQQGIESERAGRKTSSEHSFEIYKTNRLALSPPGSNLEPVSSSKDMSIAVIASIIITVPGD